MCHGDLTLEKFDGKNPEYETLSGWGNTHMCRDWDSMNSAIRKHAMNPGPNGWRKGGFEKWSQPELAAQEA